MHSRQLCADVTAVQDCTEVPGLAKPVRRSRLRLAVRPNAECRGGGISVREGVADEPVGGDEPAVRLDRVDSGEDHHDCSLRPAAGALVVVQRRGGVNAGRRSV